jgi:hypothetical protein
MLSHYFVVWGKALLAKDGLFPELLAVNHPLVTTI